MHNGYSASEEILQEIPNKLLNGAKVNLSKFTQKVRGSTDYLSKNGWKISKDRAVANSHGGSYWKLIDNKGKRIATLDEFGNILRK